MNHFDFTHFRHVNCEIAKRKEKNLKIDGLWLTKKEKLKMGVFKIR